MITPAYHQYLNALFMEHWVKIYRKEKSGSARLSALEAIDFQVDAVAKALKAFPLHVFPDRESLIIYAKRLFDETPRIPWRPKAPSDNAVRILFSSRLRRSIECLALLKYEHSEIELLLRNNDILDTEQEDSGVREYLEWFFNIRDMAEPDQHLFFTEAQKVSYYQLHCSIYWGTIDERMALAALDISGDEVHILDMTMHTLKMFMHQLRDALVGGNLSLAHKYAQTVSSLANTYARLSGNMEAPQEFLGDFINLVEPEPSAHELTLEEIRAHNRVVLESLKRNGNDRIPQPQDKTPPDPEK